MLETLFVDRWLSAVLRADPVLQGLIAGRVYSDVAPLDSAYPFVVFTRQGGVPSGSPVRVMVIEDYEVRASHRSASYGDLLEAVANRIDALLHGVAHVPVDGGEIVACWRYSEVRYLDPEDPRVRHLGGLYHVAVRTLP